MNLYPAILTGSISQAQKQLNLIKDSSEIEVVQIDVIDGEFVDNLTITPADLPELDFFDLKIDLHLMTQEPLDFVYELIAHADQLPIRAIIGQVEKMSYQVDFLEIIRKHHWQAGLSLDLFTPLEEIDRDSWEFLDFVQLMSIEAGFQGKNFNYRVVDKIKNLQQLINTRQQKVNIIVDGGIDEKNVFLLADLEIEGVAVGSALWSSSEVDQAISRITAKF